MRSNIPASNLPIIVDVTTPNIDTVVLRVRDNGVGIPRNELKRIFKRFYRVQSHATGQVKGTGLGLFIVRNIARATAATPLPKAKAKARQHIHAPSAQGLSRMSRILVVEDERHIAQGLRFNLEAEGHSVQIAETAKTRSIGCWRRMSLLTWCCWT